MKWKNSKTFLIKELQTSVSMQKETKMAFSNCKSLKRKLLIMTLICFIFRFQTTNGLLDYLQLHTFGFISMLMDKLLKESLRPFHLLIKKDLLNSLSRFIDKIHNFLTEVSFLNILKTMSKLEIISWLMEQSGELNILAGEILL